MVGRNGARAAIGWGLVFLSSTSAAAQTGGLTSRASVNAVGVGVTQPAVDPVVSGNAAAVAFYSASDNLVGGDTNHNEDVFVFDRSSGQVQRVSVSSAGAQAVGRSRYPSLSFDGRRVAFVSLAGNLVNGDTNGTVDVFVRDREANTTRRISVSSQGAQANDYSTEPAMAAEGRYVSFWSAATNLVGGDVNAEADVFLHDLATGTTELVSRASGGQQGNGASTVSALSGDGRVCAFVSAAGNLVAGDTNGVTDVFVRERSTATTVRVSVASGGAQGNGPSLEPAISRDGKLVVFSSTASNLVAGDTNGVSDVFLRDLVSGKTRRISVSKAGLQGNGASSDPALSGDGEWVVFTSDASNLVAGDGNGVSDAFRVQLASGTVERLSVSTDGVPGDRSALHARASQTGDVVVFASESSLLVPGDIGGWADVFVRDESQCPEPARFCNAKLNSLGCLPGVAWSGALRLFGGSDFHFLAYGVENNTVGVLLWGSSATSAPFAGGTLCVANLHRGPTLHAGGSSFPLHDCTGQFDFPFTSSYAQAWNLRVGSVVYGQYWMRDTGFAPPDAAALTPALQVVVCP